MRPNVQGLPPKMAQQFADRAKRGEGIHVGRQCYDFYQGNTRISLVSLDPPIGHITKLTTKELERELAEHRRAALERARTAETCGNQR